MWTVSTFCHLGSWLNTKEKNVDCGMASNMLIFQKVTEKTINKYRHISNYLSMSNNKHTMVSAEIEWVNECVNERVNEWVSEWADGWVGRCFSQLDLVYATL